MYYVLVFRIKIHTGGPVDVAIYLNRDIGQIALYYKVMFLITNHIKSIYNF